MTAERGLVAVWGTRWIPVTFVPWIVNWTMMSVPTLSPRLTIGLPLALALLLWGYRRVYGRPTWMESGTALYFALAGIFMVSGSGFFNSYGDVAGSLALAGIWMGTLAKDMPLTGEYSKWQWPEALWNNPVFVKTNAIITAFWGGVFLLQAVVALAGHYAPSAAVLWTVVRYLLLVPAFVFTAWFQKWYPARG
ncbi:MAG: hypothetical protein AB1510_07375 [Bacillota bacterium]